jgi:hypothetical protein
LFCLRRIKRIREWQEKRHVQFFGVLVDENFIKIQD